MLYYDYLNEGRDYMKIQGIELLFNNDGLVVAGVDRKYNRVFPYKYDKQYDCYVNQSPVKLSTLRHGMYSGNWVWR